MPFLITTGAAMTCSFGTAPATFAVPVPNLVTATAMQGATIFDFQPMSNIPAFAMCSSLANPAVVSATAAAQGVLTPQACTPLIMTPWTPGATMVTIGGIPALHDGCIVNCMLGGIISFTAPSQTMVEVN